jgi:hypothetical protein
LARRRDFVRATEPFLSERRAARVFAAAVTLPLAWGGAVGNVCGVRANNDLKVSRASDASHTGETTMKKLLSAGLLAVLVALATGRPADAWINARFSVGLNWSWQSGNNCLLWGVFRNGALPDELTYGMHYGGPAGVPGQQPFPWFGNATPPNNNMPQAAEYATPAGYGYGSYYYQTGYQPSYYGTGYGGDVNWYYQR